MAAAEKPSRETDDEAEAPAKPKINKRKLIIFTIIGVVVLALAGGGAFFLLGSKKKAAVEGEEEATAEKTDHKATPVPPPVYVKLDTFTTNLAPEEGTSFSTAGQYIQVVVELKADSAASGEMLKQYTPEIRNTILRLLSNKRPSQLASTEGKDALANEIRGGVNGIVNPDGNKDGKGIPGPVGSVLFSSFIIQ